MYRMCISFKLPSVLVSEPRWFAYSMFASQLYDASLYDMSSAIDVYEEFYCTKCGTKAMSQILKRCTSEFEWINSCPQSRSILIALNGMFVRNFRALRENDEPCMLVGRGRNLSARGTRIKMIDQSNIHLSI